MFVSPFPAVVTRAGPALAALALVLSLVLASLSGCASTPRSPAAAAALDWSRTRPFGAGAAFSPPPYGSLVAARRGAGTLRCGAAGEHPYGVHIELFAAGRAIRVPAGIGLAPPQRRSGALVVGGRCAYQLRTVDPTGVVEVDAGTGPPPRAGDLFALWGQPLSPHRLASFTAAPGQRVRAYLDGRRWVADPATMPLVRHAAIVFALATAVRPHPSYAFAPGL